MALRAGDAPPGFTLLTKPPYAPFGRITDNPRRRSSAFTRLVGDTWLGGFTTTFGSSDRVVQCSVDVFKRRRIPRIERTWAQEVMRRWGLGERRVQAPPSGAPGSWRLYMLGRMWTPRYGSHPAGLHSAALYFWQRGRLLGTLVAWNAVPGQLRAPGELVLSFAHRQDRKFRATGG